MLVTDLGQDAAQLAVVEDQVVRPFEQDAATAGLRRRNLAAIIAKSRRYGIQTVLIKSGDGSSTKVTKRPLPGGASQLRPLRPRPAV